MFTQLLNLSPCPSLDNPLSHLLVVPGDVRVLVLAERVPDGRPGAVRAHQQLRLHLRAVLELHPHLAGLRVGGCRGLEGRGVFLVGQIHM